MRPLSELKTVAVLGFPIAIVDYQSALDRLLAFTRLNRPTAVALCPTQVVANARIQAESGQALASFDLCLPDGMPVVWVMRAQGARLRDRVYGPYLMRYVIERTPAPYRHFLFGGSEECLDQLQAALRQLQPAIRIVGTLSPPFRAWDEADQTGFARAINAANPDFVWVALGGGKQERWIAANRHRCPRGVFLAVGDAFELLAGRRTFAPAWMQRAGLTWAYRLAQEPRRLWKRYLVYNSVFAVYALPQLLRFWTAWLLDVPNKRGAQPGPAPGANSSSRTPPGE